MWVQGLENMREKHDSMQTRLINLMYIFFKKCDHLRTYYFKEKPDFAEEQSIYCRSAEGVAQESLKLQLFSPNNVNSFRLWTDLKILIIRKNLCEKRTGTNPG